MVSARIFRPALLAFLFCAAGAVGAQGFLDRLRNRGAQPASETSPPAAATAAPAADTQPQATDAAPPPIAPSTPAQIDAALREPLVPLAAMPAFTSNLTLRGKRFYVAEYRVLFEVGGSVTASTRAGYLPGRDYGGTRVTVNYQQPQPDFAAMQQVTDRAYQDFVARLEAAGFKPEPADAFVRENGAVYESSVEPSRAGAPVYEDADVGYGKRKYLVFAPTGTKTVSRGFIGIGAGNIGKRIDYSKANLEAISVGMVVNLAAQESSGSGSAIFRRGSSANASAAMEVAVPPKTMGVLHSHARTEIVGLGAPVPVPGQFANLRETGGYDTRKDGAVVAVNILSGMAGVAGNNSKKVDMTLDVDNAAMSRMALQGLVSVNQGVVASIK